MIPMSCTSPDCIHPAVGKSQFTGALNETLPAERMQLDEPPPGFVAPHPFDLRSAPKSRWLLSRALHNLNVHRLGNVGSIIGGVFQVITLGNRAFRVAIARMVHAANGINAAGAVAEATVAAQRTAQ